MYKYTFTIFTPTFNRAKTLLRCYQSLIAQDFKDFEWLIVDDGSADGTKELIDSFISEGKINIRYYYQTNSGKHVAINKGVSVAQGKYFFILDSDDALASDALINLLNAYSSISEKQEENFTGVEGLSYTFDGKLIGTEFPVLNKSDMFDSNYLDMRLKYNILGDKHGFIKTDIMKEFPFPVFDKEKFVTESIVWNQMGLQYKTRFINKPVILAEYLSQGLSDKSILLRHQNYIGASHYYNDFLNLPYSPAALTLLRNYINLIRFSLFTNQFRLTIKVPVQRCFLLILALPLGLVFYIKDKLLCKI